VNTDALAEAMSSAARAIHDELTVDQTLDVIARAAALSVPGFEHAGISIMTTDGQIETRAATDELVRSLDRLQYDQDEGPCVSAMRQEPVVVVPHISTDSRWPKYVPRAVELGLRAQLAVRLFLDEEGTMGGLNLYSTSSETVSHEAEPVAELFAAQAAIALKQAREITHLNQALQSRKQIGQALGLVMERYQLGEDAAFSFLMRVSSHTNTKLRDVAAQLVADANGKPTHQPPRPSP
jgi:GAF domain-containing protein